MIPVALVLAGPARAAPAPEVEVRVQRGEAVWVIEVRPAEGPPRTVRVDAPRTPAEQLTVLALIESLSAEVALPAPLPPPPEPSEAPPPGVPAASAVELLPVRSFRDPVPAAAEEGGGPGSEPEVWMPGGLLPRALPRSLGPGSGSAAPTAGSEDPAPATPPLPEPPPEPVAPRPERAAVPAVPPEPTLPAPPRSAPPPTAALDPVSPPAAHESAGPAPLGVWGWIGLDLALRDRHAPGPGIASGVAIGGPSWSAGLRGTARLAREVAVAPHTTVREQALVAEATVHPLGGPVAVGLGAGVAHRRFVQPAMPPEGGSHPLPTVAAGVGLEPPWSRVGLAVGLWVEQDVARTWAVLSNGDVVVLPDRTVRIEGRLLMGRR